MQPGTISVGTSGWNYRHWRDVVYPHGLPASRWLNYLATVFDTAEVNYSFYRIPSPETVERWSAQVPADFRFAVKLWKGITHFKKLRDCRRFLEPFFAAAQMLPAAQRGPLLVQLPGHQHRDVAKLDAFLNELRELTAPNVWSVAVEFRHPSWLCDEVIELLDRQQAALCVHDMHGKGAVDEPNHVDFVYVRRHGGSDPHRPGNYTPREIEADADRCEAWREAGKNVFVYYNNDWDGHAVRNALALGEHLRAKVIR
jgi:uncharacterized protein YecE (DUF72 family)